MRRSQGKVFEWGLTKTPLQTWCHVVLVWGGPRQVWVCQKCTGVGGTRVAQPGKRLTLDFGSGRHLKDREFELHSRLCVDGVEFCLGFSLSLSLCPFPACALSLTPLKQINKYIHLKKKHIGCTITRTALTVWFGHLTSPTVCKYPPHGIDVRIP